MGKVVAASDSLDKEKTLQELWRHRFDWARDAERISAFVKRAIREGDFLMAYDAAREAVEEHRLEDVWLRQQMALTLAQLGSTARAQAILKSLLKLEPANRETLGLLGRTYSAGHTKMNGTLIVQIRGPGIPHWNGISELLQSPKL